MYPNNTIRTLVYYECCDVISRGTLEVPCWYCEEITGKQMDQLPSYHPMRRYNPYSGAEMKIATDRSMP